MQHSAILSTFIKLAFTIKTFVLPIFQWPLKTGFTVLRTDKLQGRALLVLLMYWNGILDTDEKYCFMEIIFVVLVCLGPPDITSNFFSVISRFSVILPHCSCAGFS